jgi:NADH-quinone oxidoreductase subunit J
VTLSQLFFAYFAITIPVISFLIIIQKSPVHSVLWMLLLFFNIAGLYLFLNAEFIAAIQIIVYAGAILVLFLFVIFLLDLKAEVVVRRYINQWPLSVTTAVILFVTIALSVKTFSTGPMNIYDADFIKDAGGHTKALGTVLYTDFIFPFEVASLILLVGLIGAIVLAKKHIKE